GRLSNDIRLIRMVKECGIAYRNLEINLCTEGECGMFGHTPHELMRSESPRLVHSAECAFQARGLWNDVGRTISDYTAEGEHARYVRRAVATDDALQGNDDVGRYEYRVRLKTMRSRGVAAGAPDGE